jgi:hypothetical protein
MMSVLRKRSNQSILYRNKKKSGHFLSSLLTPEAIINRLGSADKKTIFSMLSESSLTQREEYAFRKTGAG